MVKEWKAFLTLGAMAILLAGCQKKEAALFSPENQVDITVWHYYTGAQQEAFNELVEEFNQSHGKEMGITVTASSEGSVADLEQNVVAAAQKEVGAKEVPNIFAAYSDTAYKVDQMGLVADISTYFSEEEKAEYVESYLAEGDLAGDGSIKIFPVAKSTEIFMLNQTDWMKFSEATGAEMDSLGTIEGVLETAKAYYEWTDSLTEEANDGKAFFGRDAVANYLIVGAMQLGTEIISRDAEGNAVLNFPEDVMRKLWDHYYVPYINGYFSAVGRFRSDDVKTGNLVSFVGSSTSDTFFPKEVILSDEESYPIDCTVLGVPGFADGEAYAVQQGAGMVVTVAEEAQVAASVEFLKWFTDVEQNIRFSTASSYMPVKTAANNLDVIRKHVDSEGNISKALEISFNTVNQNTLYTTVATPNGNVVRDILEYSMADKAAADREEIQKMLEQGISHSDAVASYDTDDNFKEWYESTKARLEAEF